MNASRYCVLVVLLLLMPWWAGACSSQDPVPEDGLRVLFIGNSYTYTHDIPAILAQLAEASDVEPLVHQSVVAPGVSLEDHWRDGTARRIIESGTWDYVVMQQGPSSLPENQAHLQTWTQRFAEVIRDHGAEPALYMVWPDISRRSAFDAVITSYTNAATANNALLLPVGKVWQTVWGLDPNLSLYGSDGLHPSQTGAYLAAVVMYTGLYQRSPEGLPNSFRTESGGRFTVSQHDAALMKVTAASLLAESTGSTSKR